MSTCGPFDARRRILKRQLAEEQAVLAERQKGVETSQQKIKLCEQRLAKLDEMEARRDEQMKRAFQGIVCDSGDQVVDELMEDETIQRLLGHIIGVMIPKSFLEDLARAKKESAAEKEAESDQNESVAPEKCENCQRCTKEQAADQDPEDEDDNDETLYIDMTATVIQWRKKIERSIALLNDILCEIKQMDEALEKEQIVLDTEGSEGADDAEEDQKE